jgi:hypothetical protein
MANTKISALTVLGKSTFTGDDYILVARGTSANFKVSASSLLPTLADAGSGSYLLSIASQNAFTQKALASGNSLLTIANISNTLTFTVNAASINLNSCDNETAGFLKTVDLSTNKATGTLPTTKGGTGLTSFAVKSVFTSDPSTANTIQAKSMATNGTLLIGGTSGPNVATLTAGSNISITNADGGITIAGTIPATVVTKDGSGNITTAGNITTTGGDIVFTNSLKGIKYSARNLVTQNTSFSTGVTINATAGLITLFSGTVSANTQFEFTVTNSTVTTDSLIFLTLIGPGIATEVNDTYLNTHVSAISTGSFKIVLTNSQASHAVDAGQRSVQFLVIN